jgi:hypothetical protein
MYGPHIGYDVALYAVNLLLDGVTIVNMIEEYGIKEM